MSATPGTTSLLVNIKGNNRDLLGSIAGSKAAMRGLAGEEARLANATRQHGREQNQLNRALHNQSRSLKALTLDYVAVRRSLFTLGVRGAVTGFDSLTSAVGGTGQALVEVSGSALEASASLGILSAQGIGSLLQGYGVLKFSMKNVAKTMLLTGKAYETAYSKLDRPQQKFLDDMKAIRRGLEETRAMAEGPIFAGIEKGLDRLAPHAQQAQQIIYDTAQEIGYLADEGSKAVDRQSLKLYAIGERNAVTLGKIGMGGIYLGETVTQIMDGAGESIDRMSDKVVASTKRIRDDVTKLNENGGLRKFFENAEGEATNWVHTISNVGSLTWNYMKAGQPQIDATSDAIERQTKKWKDWAKSQEGQDAMAASWSRMQPVADELAKAVGATAKGLGQMAGEGSNNAVRMLRGYREELVPLLVSLGENMDKHVLPEFIDLTGNLVDFLNEAKPGLMAMQDVFAFTVDKLGDAVGLTSDMLGNLSGISKTLGGAAAPLALIAAYKGLKHLIELSLLRSRQMLGLAQKMERTGGGGTAGAGISPAFVPTSTGSGVRPRPSVAPAGFGYDPKLLYGGAGRPRIQRTLLREPLKTVSGTHRYGQVVQSKPVVPGEGVGAVYTRDSKGRLRERNTSGTRPFARIPYQPTDKHIFTNSKGQTRVVSTPPGVRPAPQGSAWTYAGVQRGARSVVHPEDKNPRYSAKQTAKGRPGQAVPSMETGPNRTRSSRISDYRNFQAGQSTPLAKIVKDTPLGKIDKVYNTRVGGAVMDATRTGMKAGIAQASKAMRSPMAKGLYGMAAFMGTTQGITTALNGGGIKNSYRDLISGLSFGAIESSGSQKDRLGQGAAALLKSGLHGNAEAIDSGVLSKDQAKALRSMKIGVPQVEAFKNQLKKLRDEGKLSAAMFRDLSKGADDLENKIKSATAMKAEFGININAKDVTGKLDQIQGAFHTMRQHTIMDLRGITGGVKYNMGLIKKNMDTQSASGKDMLAKNFRLGINAVRRNMKTGVISVKGGMAAIRQMMMQELAVYGLSGKQARNYMRGYKVDKNGQVTAGTVSPSGGKEEGTSTAAIGQARGGLNRGLNTIGRSGASGGDKVALNAVVGEGEDVIVANRHQRKALDQRLADVGGVSGFFRGRWPKHNEAPQKFGKGGIVSLGNKLVKEGYAVSEQSHFGGVHPVHAQNSYHYKDQALDVNADSMPGGEKANLDKLAKQLMAKGWHILWQVADHFDHLHVDTANGAGGMPGAAFKKLGNIQSNLPGILGGIAQGALSAVRNAANDQLRGIAESVGIGGDTSEGSIAGAKGSGMALMKSISKANGWNFADWWALDGSETSHGKNLSNPTSSARLRGQFLDMNYGAYGVGSDPRRNPTMDQQIESMAAYIKERYHNPTAAWEFHKEHNYYGLGGVAHAASAPTVGQGTPTVTGPLQGKDTTPAGKKKAAGPQPVRAMNPFTKNYETHSKSEWEKIRERWAKRPGSKKDKEPPKYGTKRPTNAKIKAAEKTSKDLLKKKGKKHKPQARFKVAILKELLKNGSWPDDPTFRDPLTGEDRDIGQLGIFNQIRALKKRMPKLNSKLDAMVVAQAESNEDLTLDLKGPELLQWAQTLGGLSPADAQLFVDQNPDGYTVPNPGGKDAIQGRPGIFEAIQELRAQLEVHGDIDFNWLNQKKAAEATDTAGPIATRRARLVEMKEIFRSNKKVMKKYKNKLKKMGKPHGWKEQVKDNDEIIDSLRDHLRLSHRLPESYRDGVNKDINDLVDLNKDLKDKKPTGKTTGRKKIEDLYANRAKEQRILVGDANLGTEWPGNGGIAQSALSSLENWKLMGQYRSDTITDSVSGDLEERSNMTDLRNQISDLDINAIVNLPVDRSADESHAAEIAAMKLEIAQAALRSSKLENAQFGTLRDFAQNVGMRFLGSFARGTTSIEKTGMALVHRNETIIPDPDGPFRNGVTMNKLRGGDSGPTQIVLVMKDNAAGLVSLVDARIDGRATQVTTRTVGQRSRLIRAAG